MFNPHNVFNAFAEFAHRSYLISFYFVYMQVKLNSRHQRTIVNKTRSTNCVFRSERADAGGAVRSSDEHFDVSL